jgi:hypothetical protein
MKTPDYTIQHKERLNLSIRVKEAFEGGRLHITIKLNGETIRKTRGFKKLAEELGDEVDAVERVIQEVVTECTGICKNDLGEIPLVLADSRNEYKPEAVTIATYTEKFGEEHIPEWALSYLINGEDDTLTDEDIETIKKGLESHGIKEVFCPADEEESSFTWSPMFGLACNEILCPVEYL